MLEALLTYINEQKLFDKNDKILLAVSGGIDSILLVDLFAKAKFNFAIAHCNFGLRAEESDADEIFVKKLAQKHKVKFHNTAFQTNKFAESQGISTQMAARELRYAWFDQILAEYNYKYLATAQHLNDSIETVLLNLTKGTGLAGMHGILPKRNKIIRPLLFATKDEIYDYVVENQLIWREDSSNESIKYQRNFIRQEIIPKLKEINPNFETGMERSIERFKDIELFWQVGFDIFRKENIQIKNEAQYLNFSSLINKLETKTFYTQIFQELGFNHSQILEIVESVNAEAGKTFNSARYTLVKDRDAFVITSNEWQQNFATLNIDISNVSAKPMVDEKLGLKFTLIENTEKLNISKNKNTAMLDFDTLGNTLALRHIKEGDWFCPLGMNKKKSLADFLNAEKVPLNLKQKTKVLLMGLSVVWVVNYRIDNRFKITDSTKNILVIEQI